MLASASFLLSVSLSLSTLGEPPSWSWSLPCQVSMMKHIKQLLEPQASPTYHRTELYNQHVFSTNISLSWEINCREMWTQAHVNKCNHSTCLWHSQDININILWFLLSNRGNRTLNFSLQRLKPFKPDGFLSSGFYCRWQLITPFPNLQSTGLCYINWQQDVMYDDIC